MCHVSELIHRRYLRKGEKNSCVAMWRGLREHVHKKYQTTEDVDAMNLATHPGRKVHNCQIDCLQASSLCLGHSSINRTHIHTATSITHLHAVQEEWSTRWTVSIPYSFRGLQIHILIFVHWKQQIVDLAMGYSFDAYLIWPYTCGSWPPSIANRASTLKGTVMLLSE